MELNWIREAKREARPCWSLLRESRGGAMGANGNQSTKHEAGGASPTKQG